MEEDAAAERERDREQDVSGFAEGLVGDEEQEKDDQQNDGDDQEQRLLGVDLVLILAAVFDRHARAEKARLDLALQPRLHLVDEAAEVAVLHVGLDEHAQAPVLAGDLARAKDAPDLRHLAEGNHLAIGRGHEHVAQPFDVIALAPFEAHLDGKSFTSLDRG